MQRAIAATFTSKQVLEGAGVLLRRGFSNAEAHRFDPFLLFDDFSSNIPEHYQAGFPWHPHRGIETVTYVLSGTVRHKDSLGNEGVIESGDLQWMTAGSGIIHEEMPESVHGIRGFQLWVNLPRDKKMSAPRYQDLKGRAVPDVAYGAHAHARVIAGELGGVVGPLESLAGGLLYADISLEAGQVVAFPIKEGNTVFVYVIDGAVAQEGTESFQESGTIILFDRTGGDVVQRASPHGARFLLVSGAPLGEPVAWRGPVVMNTKEELDEAFAAIRNGTFIQHQPR